MPPKDAMVVEVTGKQFGWEFRYPGRDGILGKKYYKKIDPAKNNPVGQIWDDPANHDDIWMEQEMHLVVNKPVKLIIGSKDVIHDVGLVTFPDEDGCCAGHTYYHVVHSEIYHQTNAG